MCGLTVTVSVASWGNLAESIVWLFQFQAGGWDLIDCTVFVFVDGTVVAPCLVNTINSEAPSSPLCGDWAIRVDYTVHNTLFHDIEWIWIIDSYSKWIETESNLQLPCSWFLYPVYGLSLRSTMIGAIQQYVNRRVPKFHVVQYTSMQKHTISSNSWTHLLLLY